MTDQFLNEIMRSAVSVLCQSIGWNSAQTTTIDILGDIWKRQFLQISKTAHRNSEHCGRTEVTIDDAMFAFSEMGISCTELEEYIHNFDPVPLPYKVPNFPVPRENHLNFLRAGSAEVLTRPVHIHEYMPPWTIPSSEDKKESRISESMEVGTPPPVPQSNPQEKEAEPVVPTNEDMEKENLENGIGTNEKSKTGDLIKGSEAPQSPPLSSSESNSFINTPPKSTKRMETPGESPALKRVRMMLEEEGHPLRQISSVIMTMSGYLTSSREGRLPEARPPLNRDFFETPPPLPVEKKKKIPTMKRIVEGVKKIDKEKDLFDLFENPDKIITQPAASREGGEERASLKTKDGKGDSSRREKDLNRKNSSNKKNKDSSNKKNRLKLETSHRINDKKYKLPEREMKEKLNIFKKNMMKSSEKLARKAMRMKLKKQKETAEEEGLDVISSDENFEEGEMIDVKPDIDAIASKSRGRRSNENPDQHLIIKKIKKEKSPLAVPLPKISPKFRDIPIDIQHAVAAAGVAAGVLGEFLPKKKRGRPKKNIVGLPPMPGLTLGTPQLKITRISKKIGSRFIRDALIPEISITKPPPPPLDFPMLIGRLPLQPGLIPSSFASPPSMRKSSNLPPSISITPATPTVSGTSSPLMSKDNRNSQSLPLPSSVCSSVTITRIDMSNSQKLPTPYDNSSTPGIGPQMSISISPQSQKPGSSNLTIQADSHSGITITPIVMDKGTGKIGTGVSQPEKDKIEKGSVLAKLEEDIRTKEQRKKDREKRKELKKEKKKERKEKERIKSVKFEKVEKKEKKDKEKDKEKEKEKEKKKKTIDTLSLPPEGVVPKLTLKLHSNANTPVDSPNPPQRIDDRNDTPPPARKFTIKPVEEMIKKRTPSPELARFSPLVTRPPKSNKITLSTKSPGITSHPSSPNEVVSFPPPVSGSKRGPGRPPKSGRGPGRPPKSSQAGLVTETVGFYIDDNGTKVWICPSCGRQDDGSPMIGCDTCDDWYHFTCVGIQDTPDETESWFCKRCISTSSRKKSSSSSTSEHKKKALKL